MTRLSFSEIRWLPQDFNQHPGIYLTATLLTIIALFFVFAMKPVLSQPLNVSSFDECIELPHSRIQESFPSTCVTEDGQSFAQSASLPSQQTTSSAKPAN